MGGTDVELVKADSDLLAGTLAEELGTDDAAFSGAATQVLKFHGIYQQDDRDVRRDRQRAGLGKDYQCMVRASIPGGALTAEQYLAADALADRLADGSLRVTTRQGLQWHGVHRGSLQTLIAALDAAMLTTLAACGDVVRNVMTCPAPGPARVRWGADRVADDLARHLRPRTPAYWSLWLDGERAVTALSEHAVGDLDGPEPLYGRTYLPRKFKIAIAHPGDDCVDAYSQDLAIVPRLVDDTPTRFTLLAGGGLGMSHNNPATFPRLADPLGDVAPADLLAAVVAVIATQRDHGDRSDRKHARLKYLVEERGIAWLAEEVAARSGVALGPASALAWDATTDHLGWHPQAGGGWFLGVPVTAGRIVDRGPIRLRTALRTLVASLGLGVRLTPRQDVLLTAIADAERRTVTRILREHGVPTVDDLLPVARHALACPALPTCGLAIAEAERILDDLVGDVARVCHGLGIADDAIHIRVTGCPNGCARPYATEIGIVGRGKDHYSLFLGGDAAGTRLGTQVADRVPRAGIADLLAPVLADWRDGRDDGEAFGAWCHRVGSDALQRRLDDALVSA